MESDQMESSRLDFSSSEKKHDVTYVEEWIKSLDEQLMDFGSDVSAVEVLKRISDDLMSMGSIKSFDSGVSLKSDQSRAELIDFKDRVSPRLMDFSSSKEEHVVSDDDDLYEFPDNQEKMNQELSSEVGWKRG